MAKTMDTADKILSDGELESCALRAKDLLEEHRALGQKMQMLIKSMGAQPQEPIPFLHGVLHTYALNKLKSKIVTL
jgi:hypothetical protein